MIGGPPPPPSLKKVKFHQNRPIYEEIYVYEGRRGGEGPLIINFYLNYYW